MCARACEGELVCVCLSVRLYVCMYAHACVRLGGFGCDCFTYGGMYLYDVCI